LKISLFNWDLTVPKSAREFIGFSNYINLFHNPEFWSAIWVTFRFTVASVCLTMIIGVALAFLMFQNLRGSNIVRTFVIAAMVIAPIVIGTAWRLMYNPGWGLINYFLIVLHIGSKPFLAQASLVLPAVIAVDVWQWSPLVMIIVLAALQGLPMEVYESARVDGASLFQVFVHITLPLIQPALLLALLIRTMDAFRVFDTVYAMTGGGPGIASENLNILMYNTGFEFFQVSKAAAMAIVSLVIITVVCMYIVKIFKSEDMEI
jgi:multiple sugar transport system permease protein